MLSTRGLPLLQIADHAARKSQFPYGCLVGKRLESGVTIHETFDLKTAVSGGLLLADTAFLEKKAALLRANTPNLAVVGVYTANCDERIPQLLCSQICAFIGEDPVVALVPSTHNTFKCYNAATWNEIECALTPGESEEVAVSTIQNHANYSLADVLDNAMDSKMDLSLQQLQFNMRRILDLKHTLPAWDSLLVHLAHLVSNFQTPVLDNDHQLRVSHLCLLTAQIVTVRYASVQANRQVSLLGKGRGRSITVDRP